MFTILQISIQTIDSLMALNDSAVRRLPIPIQQEVPEQRTVLPPEVDLQYEIIGITLILVGILVLYVFSTFFENRISNLSTKRTIHQLSKTADTFVYVGKDLQFSAEAIDDMLKAHFPFYYHLSATLQPIFVNRVLQFINGKVFVIRTPNAYMEMPVLISAAAIQLTFGLKAFRLPYYRFIQVHPKEYLTKGKAPTLILGHVYKKTITVAWDHFYHGTNIPNDGVNVGLHEMAHALYFQKLTTKTRFGNHFFYHYKLMEKASATHFSIANCMYNLYKDNAFKNRQEFWAESIELFFERPIELQKYYAGVFEHIQTMLKQNPLNAENPLVV